MWGRERPGEILPGRGVSAEDVFAVRESPFRLPVRFANQIYDAGETGFGVTAFTLVFCGWYKRNYAISGSMIDFLNYPFWLGPSKVTDVVLYPQKRHLRPTPPVLWCAFLDGDAPHQNHDEGKLSA